MKMSKPFFTIELKDKIDAISISPFEWSKNLICISFKSKLAVGLIKFQEEFINLEHEVALEILEEFYHGPRVHHIAWSPISSLHKVPMSIQLCAAGSDFSLRVFTSDHTSRKHTRKEIEGHDNYINGCSFNIDGDILASVSDDLTCKLWGSEENFSLINTFNLTSPGMSVCWHQTQPNKLLVAEKNGIFRLYSSMTPITSIICSPTPLTNAEWPSSNLVAFIAAGILHRADITVPGHMVEHKTVHPEGGYAVAVCPANQNYIATAGRPNNSLKITNIKTKLTIVTTELKLFGGFSWHSRLPMLCVADNSSLAIFKISPNLSRSAVILQCPNEEGSFFGHVPYLPLIKVIASGAHTFFLAHQPKTFNNIGTTRNKGKCVIFNTS